MRVCIYKFAFVTITYIINFITAVTNNTANIGIACYRSAICCISNMRISKCRTNNTAYHAAAGNTAANKRHIINISIMRNTKQTNISFTFSINS